MTQPDARERDTTPSPYTVRRSRAFGSAGSDSAGPTLDDRNHPPGNLPRELSSFVGREQEITEIKRLLGDTRLLTLKGPGGSGKTRLALAVASDLVEEFEDGVWWVELASLPDPDLLPQAIAQTLMIREESGRSLVEALARDLAPTELLLVLDNCEHLVGACAALADTLLRSCPGVRILATSREVLGIGGEISWQVPSLSVPDAEQQVDLEALVGYEAIGLFVERAKATAPSFELTEDNAGAVGRLCRRLDGMPLAIELAAARVRVLSVEQILKRVEDSLRLLMGTSRTTHERQRTLRGTLDWSYELLSEAERLLSRRLSVFAGGWTLEAAEAVGAGDDIEEDEVLDLLSRLVDKSLVIVEEASGESGLRYRMLEPVRQYGLERLAKSGETERVRDRHARYYLALAEEAEPELREQEAWLKRLEREHPNFRAALSWALDRQDAQPEEGRAEVGLRLAAALARGRFWSANGMSEGRRWLEMALTKSSMSPTSVRAKALMEAGWIATHQGDYEQAVALLEESVALFKGLEDKPGVAGSIFYLGHLAMHGGDYDRVRVLGREAEALRHELVDRQAIAQLLYFLGAAALCEGDHAGAVALLEESLAHNRELGDLRGAAICFTLLGITALEQDDPERAAAQYEEDMRLLKGLRDKLGIAYGLRGMSCVAALQGDAARAARLWGSSEAVGQTIGLHLSPFDRSHPDYEGLLAAARSRLDEAAWEAARSEGKAMTPEEAIEYALGKVHELPVPPAQQPTPPPVPAPAPAEARGPAELRIFALGGAQVEMGERTLTSSDFGYAKPRELLFYLLSHPPRTREQIGLALWPEASTSQLRGSFHEALRRLRKALGGSQWIVHENRRYSFNHSLKGHYLFDVEAFESELTEARKAKQESAGEAIVHLKETVRLYQGDFLEGFAAEGEWALVRQGELRRSYQDALQSLGVLLFSEGRYSEAAQAYRKIIAMDRYSEAAHRELMRSEAASGERGRALEHYAELVELLRRELGSSPAPETVALYEEVLRGEEV